MRNYTNIEHESYGNLKSKSSYTFKALIKFNYNEIEKEFASKIYNVCVDEIGEPEQDQVTQALLTEVCHE